MTRTRWIIFIAICLVILGLVIAVNKKDNAAATYKGDPAKIITEGPVADHVFGNSKSQVVLIEYGDYECPGCEALYTPLKDVVNQYKNQIAFVFRNLPLTTIHANALAAATAAEAAGLQGRYYEYHDILYDNQDAWKDAQVTQRESLFDGYARQLGLDVNKFKTDLTNNDVGAKIDRDRSLAGKLGLTSTPTLVLDGQKLSQDITFDKTKLTAAINDELKARNITPPTMQNQ
jgi:protein-disulfide isomerase